MTGRVVARVDADARIGLGHLKRTRTLLIELARRGFSVRIVGRLAFDGLEAFVGELPVVPLASPESEEQDAASTLAAAGPGGDGAWVLVDHYGLGARWEQALQAGGYRVVALDDLRDRAHTADVLVSDTDTPFSPELDRRPGGARQLLGVPYTLLDPEFAPGGAAASGTVLVTYGGSDPTGETLKALAAIRRIRAAGTPAIGRVAIVVGPVNERRREIEEQARALDGVDVHVGPPSLAPLMHAAELVLASCGSTVAEALSVGRPCLVTVTAENQSRMHDFLVAQDAVVSLGAHGGVDGAALVGGVERLLAARDRLASRLRERPVFDVHAAGRIAQALETYGELR